MVTMAIVSQREGKTGSEVLIGNRIVGAGLSISV